MADLKSVRASIQEKLPKIKELLFGDETPEVEEQFEDVKKADGTILRINPMVEVGANVEVIGEDGEMIVAPDGEHELEDGTVISVEGGIIIEVIPIDAPEVEEEMSTDEVEETPEVKPNALDVDALKEQIVNKLNEAITEKINGLKFNDTVDALKKENKELKEAVKLMSEIVEKFSDEPSEEPKKRSKNPFAKEKRDFNYSSLMSKKK